MSDGQIDEGLRNELQRQGIWVTSMQELYNWGRKNSIWPLQFGLACCAIEMIATAASRYDIARFGGEVFRPSPRQADFLTQEQQSEFRVPAFGEHDLNPPANPTTYRPPMLERQS